MSPTQKKKRAEEQEEIILYGNLTPFFVSEWSCYSLLRTIVLYCSVSSLQHDKDLLISLILVQYTNTYGSIKSFTDSHIKQRFIPTIVYITLLCQINSRIRLRPQFVFVSLCSLSSDSSFRNRFSLELLEKAHLLFHTTRVPSNCCATGRRFWINQTQTNQFSIATRQPRKHRQTAAKQELVLWS